MAVYLQALLLKRMLSAASGRKMAILACVPDHLQEHTLVFRALQLQNTRESFEWRWSNFDIVASSGLSALTPAILNEIVDVLRPHLSFPVRPPQGISQVDAIESLPNREKAGDDAKYTWRWLSMNITWVHKGTHAQFPLPVAKLESGGVDGFHHLVSLTAFWGLST